MQIADGPCSHSCFQGPNWMDQPIQGPGDHKTTRRARGQSTVTPYCDSLILQK